MGATFSTQLPLLAIRVVITADVSASYNYTTTRSLRIVDVMGYKNAVAGGAGDTLQVLNVAAAISDVVVLNVAANTVFRALEVNQTNAPIASGGTLRITMVQVTNTGCEAVVQCLAG